MQRTHNTRKKKVTIAHSWKQDAQNKWTCETIRDVDKVAKIAADKNNSKKNESEQGGNECDKVQMQLSKVDFIVNLHSVCK